jgi:hypothetical protein
MAIEHNGSRPNRLSSTLRYLVCRYQFLGSFSGSVFFPGFFGVGGFGRLIVCIPSLMTSLTCSNFGFASRAFISTVSCHVCCRIALSWAMDAVISILSTTFLPSVSAPASIQLSQNGFTRMNNPLFGSSGIRLEIVLARICCVASLSSEVSLESSCVFASDLFLKVSTEAFCFTY